MKLSIIEQIKLDLEMEGRIPGSPDFEYHFLERRVQVCMERHHVGSCQECPFYDECPLVKEYMVLRYYGPATTEKKEQ